MISELNVEPWLKLNHPLVRDLAWCIFSPSLTLGESAKHSRANQLVTPLEFEWLTKIDLAPQALSQWMSSCPSTRLGIRFERFWQFWWNEQSLASDEHLFNRQIHQKGKTIGEVDALHFDGARHTLTHSELAVKFYLAVPQATELKYDDSGAAVPGGYYWLGPNLNDRLDLKWSQLTTHQLQVARNNLAALELPEHWLWDTLQTEAIVRGRLFYPMGCDRTITQPTEYINPQHLAGYWLNFDAFEHLAPAHWLLVEHQQWFAPLQTKDETALLDNTEMLMKLSRHFESSRRPIQIAEMTQGCDGWHERARAFVMPNQWPTVTLPSRKI